MVLEWILLGFIVYWFFIMVLDRMGVLERYNVSTAGPLLLLRTLRGRDFLDWLASRNRGLWRIYGNIGFLVAFFVMVVSFVGVVLVGYMFVTLRPEPSPVTEPRNILAIPGVNEFLPLSMAPEIAFGLFLGIIVHEGGHGVMCRVGDIGVESMGIVSLAVLPVGAFVEPNDEEVEAASSGSRIRMFSAGVMNNFVITVLLFVLLATAMMGVDPVDGVGVQNSSGLAYDAGVVQGDVIQSVDGVSVDGVQSYLNATENTSGNVSLGVYREGSTRNVSLNLTRGALVTGTVEGYPAHNVLEDGDLITSINGSDVTNASMLSAVLGGFNPGDSVRVSYLSDGGMQEVVLELGRGPEGGAFLGVRTATPSKAYLIGVTPYDIDGPYTILSSYNPVYWIASISLPLGTVTNRFFGFDGYLHGFYELQGAASLFGGFYWVFLNVLFWSAWINLIIGQFNCIPALPLDGGHIFREIVKKTMRPFSPEEITERVSGLATVFVTALMFGTFALMILGPRLLF